MDSKPNNSQIAGGVNITISGKPGSDTKLYPVSDVGLAIKKVGKRLNSYFALS